MNDDRGTIDKIQQELKELSHKHLELTKAHQQRVQAYEQQKTLYQRLFGQPPLLPDPELQSFNSEIAHLKARELEYIKVLQASASITNPEPEDDWTKSPFYSHTLKKWKFDYPADQMGFYVATLSGTWIVSKTLWKSWNIEKAGQLLEKGGDPDMLSFHRHFTGMNNGQIKDARTMQRVVKLKAFALAGLLVGGFTGYVRLKNRNRTDK